MIYAALKSDLTIYPPAIRRALRYLMEHRQEMQPDLYEVPREIDDQVSRIKLDAMGLKVDTLTEDQQRYLAGWEV